MSFPEKTGDRSGGAAVFFLLSCGLGWPVMYLARPDGFPKILGLAMTAPLAAAFFADRRFFVKERVWGVKGESPWRAVRWCALAVLLAWIVVTLPTALAVFLAKGVFPTCPPSFRTVRGLAGLPLFFLLAAAEEYGWRGFLWEKLAKPFGVGRAALLTGLAWGLWHLPAVLWGTNYPGRPLAGILLMTLFCLAWGVILARLYSESGTILAPAAAHFTLNLLVGPQDRSLLPRLGLDPILYGASGLCGILAAGTVAFVLLFLGNHGGLAGARDGRRKS